MPTQEQLNSPTIHVSFSEVPPGLLQQGAPERVVERHSGGGQGGGDEDGQQDGRGCAQDPRQQQEVVLGFSVSFWNCRHVPCSNLFIQRFHGHERHAAPCFAFFS
jgi:hypothetical protein